MRYHLTLDRMVIIQFSSVQFSHSVVSDSLRPHESKHARPPCPSPTPGVYSNPCPSSWWCHPAMVIIKSVQIINVGESTKEKKQSYILGGNVNWCSHNGKQYRDSSKNRVAIWSCNPTSGHIPEKTIVQKDTCTSVFITALFTIAKTWEQPNCPLTDEWIKMWYIYAMEYYSAIKKNKIMSFAATRIDLEIVILSEVSQEEDKYYMISLICGI